MGTSPIEWLRNRDGTRGKTWVFLTGCKEKSPGCANCYSARLTATRLKHHPKYKGLAVIGANGHPRFTGEMRFHPEVLSEPLSWRKPQRVFPSDMSDMFHPNVKDEWIAAAFGVMAATPRHTYILLTKWPERMKAWFEWVEGGPAVGAFDAMMAREIITCATWTAHFIPNAPLREMHVEWPLPNVWLGISAERQKEWDERWPFLRDTPAAKRLVSYEPALEEIDFSAGLRCQSCGHFHPAPPYPCTSGKDCNEDCAHTPGLDWLIAGGESGPKARPCDIAWMRSARDQARAGGAAFFFKQAGSRVITSGALAPGQHWLRSGLIDTGLGHFRKHLVSKKGNDPSEWPEDLRDCRAWPT